MISALTVPPRQSRLGLYVRFHHTNLTGIEVLDFLLQLQRHIRRPMVLLWDGGPIHCRKIVKDYIAGNRQRLQIYRFPLYAPELSPDEHVWTHSKACLANDAPGDIDELNDDLRVAIARMFVLCFSPRVAVQLRKVKRSVLLGLHSFSFLFPKSIMLGQIMRQKSPSVEKSKLTVSTKTAIAASKVLEGRSHQGFFRQLLPFLGPAFIASVAYIDPGNFATNIQAGAQFGNLLLWAIIGSNVMAAFVQVLAAKLGIATRKNLAEHYADQFAKPISFGLWITMELSAMASDLTGVVGAAVGFNLLFGMPLWSVGLVVGVATFLLLGFKSFGFRSLETTIAAFVGVVSVCYLIETLLVKPPWGDVITHTFVPRFEGYESLVLAAGIVGATVTPYAIILHSSLTQHRVVPHSDLQRKRLFGFEIADVIVAMGTASLVHMAILVMAAGTFHQHGAKDVGTLEQAYRTLQPLLGRAATWVFAISLIASGLSSATVVTHAGQVILQGFLNRRIPIWVRRLITLVPSFVIILAHLDPTRSLVISQVILSISLPLVLVPLVIFTGRKDLMGNLVNGTATKTLMSVITVIIIAMNAYLLYEAFTGG